MPYAKEEDKQQYLAEYRKTMTPEQRHKYYVNFKSKREKSWRKYMYKTLYGITQDDYNLMLEKQQGLCAICKRPPKDDQILHVDHCHTTGKIRGLLCSSCNTSIGKLGGISGLEAALDYLKEFYRRELKL